MLLITLVLTLLGTTLIASVSTAQENVRRGLFLIFVILLGNLSNEFLDVNLVSREWYKGTTRGFEISLADIFLMGLLLSALISPIQSLRKSFTKSLNYELIFIIIYGFILLSVKSPKLFSLFEIFKYCKCFLLLWTLKIFFQDPKYRTLFFYGVFFISTQQLLMSLYQRYFLGIHRVPGGFGHPNELAFVMAALFVFFIANSFYTKKKLPLSLSFLGAISSIICCVLSVSRAPMISIPICLCLFLILALKKVVSIKGLIIALFLFFSISLVSIKSADTILERLHSISFSDEMGATGNSENKFKGRFSYFLLAKLIVGENPFGVGLNNWSWWASKKYGPMMDLNYYEYIDEHTPVFDDEYNLREVNDVSPFAAPAHNLYLLILGEQGYLGLLIWLFFMGRVFITGLYRWIPKKKQDFDKFSFIALFPFLSMCLSSMFEYVLALTTCFYLFLAFVAMILTSPSPPYQKIDTAH